MSNNLLGPFFDRRFVLVLGKGGVGRSSICAGIALAASRQGKRVLVCELNARERIPAMFGSRPVGSVITEIAPGIESVNMRPEDAMREYGLMKLRIRALYRAAFENRFVKSFLNLIPGLPELLMLGKAFFHESEIDPATGRHRWDMVVVDAPATGHGVPFLRIPRVVLSVAPAGPMAEDAKRMQALLTDPTRTSLNIATIPEAMPISEAVQLKGQVDRLLQIPTGFLFENAVHRPLLDAGMEGTYQAILRARRAHAGPSAQFLGSLLDAGEHRIRRNRIEAAHIAHLAEQIEMPRIRIPYLYLGKWGLPAAEAIADVIESGVRHHELGGGVPRP
jgi:hypothetical protein